MLHALAPSARKAVAGHEIGIVDVRQTNACMPDKSRMDCDYSYVMFELIIPLPPESPLARFGAFLMTEALPCRSGAMTLHWRSEP